jgi:hypothetical protein
MARVVTVAVREGKLAHEHVSAAHIRVTIAEGGPLSVNEPGRHCFRATAVFRALQTRAGRGDS